MGLGVLGGVGRKGVWGYNIKRRNPIRAEMASSRPRLSRGSGISPDVTERQALRDADSHCSGPFGPRVPRDEEKNDGKGAFCRSMAIFSIFFV